MAYCINCGETDNFMYAKKNGKLIGFFKTNFHLSKFGDSRKFNTKITLQIYSRHL